MAAPAHGLFSLTWNVLNMAKQGRHPGASVMAPG